MSKWYKQESEEYLPLDCIDAIRKWIEDYEPYANGRIKLRTIETDIEWGAKILQKAVLKFKSEEDWTFFLLGYSDLLNPKRKVILQSISKTMPKVIADEIIGVQPMNGPVGQIFTMKSRYKK